MSNGDVSVEESGKNFINNDNEDSVDKKEDADKEVQAIFPGFGIICAILSAALYSCNAALVKMVDLPSVHLSFSRCCVQFLILLPIIQGKHKTVDILGPVGLKSILWIRGFVGSSGMMLLYFAIKELTVGNAITIVYLNMVIVPFVAKILVKESLSFVDFIFALISLCGVVLITKPTFIFPNQGVEEISSVLGIVYGLLAATFNAVTIVLVRKLGPVTFAPLNVLYYSFCGSITTLLVSVATEEFNYPCLEEVPFVLTLSVLGLLSQILTTIALRTERAGVVSILGSTQIIFVYILQVALLGDIPSTLSIVGASLILSCSIGVGIRKLLKERIRKRSIAN